MFDDAYPHKYKGKRNYQEGEHSYVTHVFTFRASKSDNQVFVVNVEEYLPYHIFVVKFYQKSLKRLDNKYNQMTNTYDATRKIATCIDIMLEFLEANPYSSFGFVGANNLGEGKNTTKRFRVYRKVMTNFFSPISFEHIEWPERAVT